MKNFIQLLSNSQEKKESTEKAKKPNRKRQQQSLIVTCEEIQREPLTTISDPKRKASKRIARHNISSPVDSMKDNMQRSEIRLRRTSPMELIM